MSSNSTPLIGDIVERKSTTRTPPKSFTPSQAGFPVVQHRSKSAFARSRDHAKKSGPPPARDALPPAVKRISEKVAADSEDWRDQISRENQQRVESMTEQEREQERREILERFGPEVGDILKRSRLGRQKQASSGPSQSPNTGTVVPPLEEVPITSEEVKTPKFLSPRGSPPPPALSIPSTRPSSRADRRLRFAELGPQNVHVYESAPPSPRRKTLALPPPDENDNSTVSLGTWSGPRKAQLLTQAQQQHWPMETEPTPPPSLEAASAPNANANTRPASPASPMDSEPTRPPIVIPDPVPPGHLNIADSEPEEGSAEYIRRRYFSNAPANDPNLAWMQVEQDASTDTDIKTSLRFDLSGKPIPPSISSTLPTHLGLHHHAEGTHAGYTLEDIFLLARSTVPAQRATMLGVLARIAAWLPKAAEDDEMAELTGKEEELRKRIVAAGVERVSERGSVGARAAAVIWQCVVGWDEEIAGLDDVELEISKDAAIKLLKPEEFLPVLMTIFSQGEATKETRVHLLQVILRLARQSNEYASATVTTPKLVNLLVQEFLQTLFPPIEGSPSPNPVALELLTTLTKASRTNALVVREYADTALRFITVLPITSSPDYRLIVSLLVNTLQFYTALAGYGLSSYLASTALEQFARLSRYILSDACTSRRLMTAWAKLIEAWMICAIDPHRTTPDHEILWSHIIAFGWNTDVQDLQDRLKKDETDWAVWAGAWNATAAWLEGARVNGLRGGSGERMEALEIIRFRFEDNDNGTRGIGKEVVIDCIKATQSTLSRLSLTTAGLTFELTRAHLPLLRSLAGYTTLLASVIRLWVACLPPVSEGPLSGPPFPLPFPEISELCAKVIGHPIWGVLGADEDVRRYYVFLRPVSALLSTYLRVSRRLPGIPEPLWMAQVLSIVQRLLPGEEDFALQVQDELLQLVEPQWLAGLRFPVPTAIWERGGMDVIRPFLENNTRPRAEVSIGPFIRSPGSILNTNTQRLPSSPSLNTFGLPLGREWTLTPLDHLLRSGNSEVFRSLPPNWDASEVEVVRASLLLAVVGREILHRFSLFKFVLTREEAIFGCMNVFMLENGQLHNDSSEEVFRDHLVGQLMEELLKPYTLEAASELPSSDLEKAALPFLGQTPFYQYYTDFVSLYDAISFSNPLFARLLLSPTSMKYPIDYRRYLWNDFAHILKTIRTPIEQVISGDLKEYLLPIERDPQMIGCYLRSLLKDQLRGLLQMVAIQHVSANIWLVDEDGWAEDRARKLLQSVVGQGNHDLVRSLVLYSLPEEIGTSQSRITSYLPRPIDDQTKSSRLVLVQAWGLQDRIGPLLA